jgi:hypothetical protein
MVKRGYENVLIRRLHLHASITLDEKHLAAIGRVAASWSLSDAPDACRPSLSLGPCRQASGASDKAGKRKPLAPHPSW